jgi:multiple sugar transport system substrate-binding protein
MRKIWWIALLGSLLLVLAAGCGSDGADDEGDSGAPDAEAAPEPRAQGDVTWCIGKDTTGAFSTVVENFNEGNPDATVRLLELPESADEQRRLQIQRLRAESAECDVLGMDVIWTAEYAAQRWLLDVTDAVEQRRDEFIPSTLETARYEDSYWAIPFNTNAGFIYWRTDQAGEQPPEDWQSMYESARETEGLVYQGFRYEGLTVNFLELLYSAGGSVVSEDGSEATADSEEVRDVLAFMRRGIASGAVPQAVTTYKEEESRRAFESGNATFMRNWPYAYALGKRARIADSFEITTFPSYAGNEGSGVLGGYNLAISAYSRNPAGSLAFINFATSADQQVIQAAEASLPPVVSAVYDDAQVQEALPFATELRDAVSQARPRPVSPVYPQISQAVYENVYSVLQGQMSPEQGASQMNEEIEQALATF